MEEKAEREREEEEGARERERERKRRKCFIQCNHIDQDHHTNHTFILEIHIHTQLTVTSQVTWNN